ncbi:MAG TPA: erythromycin esterase family protein [Longimicrobium sp.]|nr:erythromycin esterase family protein [Longimicrobium sp.]
MAARISGLFLVLALAACSGGGDAPTQPTPPAPEVPAEATAWLKANAIPFNTSQAGGPNADLMPLKNIVGSARIVSLGEATHGTREFFEMKHRVFEFLVREMGFTTFAMEAEWAESARMNEYVQTGRGDPEVLLTGLYFWTWDTREVLDLIQWMRAWNADPAHTRKVRFAGVDAQFPTLAMDTVVAYLRGANPADPSAAIAANERYACLRPYSNDSRGVTHFSYTSLTAAVQQECRARVQQVYDDILANRVTLEAATSPAGYAYALRAARLAVQGEDVRSEREPGSRDRYMAENATWWLDQAGPEGKVMIWAHNAHVSTVVPWMGSHLRARFGAEMRVLGFRFYQGTFNAVNLDAQSFGAHTFGPAPAGSYESYFHSAGLPRFILDLRVDTSTPATSWLAGPRLVREVGCCVRPSLPNFANQTMSLPSAYDAIIFFDNTTPSQMLEPKFQ